MKLAIRIKISRHRFITPIWGSRFSGMWCNAGKKAGHEVPYTLHHAQKTIILQPQQLNLPILETYLQSFSVQSKCPNSNMHIARH